MNKHLFTLIQILLFIQQIIMSSQTIIQDDPSSTEVDLNNTRTPYCDVNTTVDVILYQLTDVPPNNIQTLNHLRTIALYPCETVVLNILSGIIDLQEVITKQNDSQLSSSAYRILEFKYLLRTQEIQVEIQTLYNMVDPDDKDRIRVLEIELQTFQDQAKEGIATLRCQQKKQFINTCISQIDEYEMDEDAQKCGELDHDQQTKLIKVASKHVNSDIILRSEHNQSYLDQLVRNVYGEHLFEATLKFINGLHTLDEKSIALTSLLNAMKEKSIDTPDILRLAYHVKEIMSGSDEDYLNQPREVISRFEALKSNLPPSVKAIFWDIVLIKNRLHDEYLIATMYPFDNNWRWIFTWRHPGMIVPSSEWKLDTINEGRSFRIKSLWSEEYMSATSHAQGPYEFRSSVLTWRHENEIDQIGEWLLEPIEGATAFKLKTVYRNEYLYAGADDLSYDSDRRKVFTCRHKGKSAPFGEIWEINAWSLVGQN